MSATRKVTIIATRHYYKQVEINVDIPMNLRGEDLVEHLKENKKVASKFEEQISSSSLCEGDDEFLFLDKEFNFGGHL